MILHRCNVLVTWVFYPMAESRTGKMGGGTMDTLSLLWMLGLAVVFVGLSLMRI